MPQPHVSLARIAAEVGVSTATVSMALRGHASISAATRARVLAAAEALGYRPDPRFSALMEFLRSRKEAPFHAVIAFVHDYDTAGRYLRLRTPSEFFNGARERGRRLGFQLEPFWARESGLTLPRLAKILRARGIPGAILTSPRATSFPFHEDLADLAVAVVGYTSWTPQYCRACNNQHHSMTLALQSLEARGYRRIGLALSSQDDADAEHNWLSAYLGFHHGLPANRRPPPLLGPESDIFTTNALSRWLSTAKPDCVIGHTNPLLDRLLATGIRIPDEMGFATLDIFERDDHLPVSGIEQHSAEVGAAAMDMVTSQISFQKCEAGRSSRLVLIEGEWVDGATTKLPQAAATAPGGRRAPGATPRRGSQA